MGGLIAIVVGLSSVLGSCTSGGSRPERANESDVQAEVTVEEASVDGDGGVILPVRSVGPVAAADTLITIHGGPGLSLEAMEG